jgi:hypothetical protein
VRVARVFKTALRPRKPAFRLRLEACSTWTISGVANGKPAIEASGIRTPAGIYDLRSTFASNALADGVSVFQLARVMGTSVRMIERHYGALLDGSGAEIARLLDAGDTERERRDEREQSGG